MSFADELVENLSKKSEELGTPLYLNLAMRIDSQVDSQADG